MRIAVTYENGFVGQHFGRTEEFKLYDVEDGGIVQEQILSANGQSHGMLAALLKGMDVELLICGGIGMGARYALNEMDIELIPGVQGRADEAVRAYLSGTLVYDPDAECCHHDHEHSGDKYCHTA